MTGSRGAYLALAAIVAGMITIVTLVIKTDYNTAQKLKSVWQKFVIAVISLFALVLIAVPKITKDFCRYLFCAAIHPLLLE